MTIYERIKFVANKRKMNLREVARKSGFKSETAIYRYNQGVHPRDTTLEAIASTLGTTVAYLKGETDDWANTNKARNNKKSVDLKDDNFFMTYGGRPVTDEELEMMRRIARGGDDD